MKKLANLALAGMMILAIAGCGGGAGGGKTPTAKAVNEAVAAATPFVDTMTYVDDAQFSKLFRIDMEKVQECSAYTATLASAEEVTVIRMKNAADVQLAVDAMKERLEDKKIAFETYIPEEMTKINAAQIYTNGAYACLVVADDTSKSKDAFDGQF